MSLVQALIIAVVQGATELFPVSSLGHAVILPSLLDWNFNQQSPTFLPFLVVLHLGTAAALLLFFWRDWWDLFVSFIGQGPEETRASNRRLIMLIVIATIPAVIVGFALEKPLRHLFGTPAVAAAFLIVNGYILFGGERLRQSAARRGPGASLAEMRISDAVIIGLFQCLALIPGISRSGSTIVGGLLRGLHHEAAAHFSFLIATPIILGAAVLEVPKMLHAGTATITMDSVLAGLTAGVIAYLSVWALMRYFEARDFQALDPFAAYCWLIGAFTLGKLYLGV